MNLVADAFGTLSDVCSKGLMQMKRTKRVLKTPFIKSEITEPACRLKLIKKFLHF